MREITPQVRSDRKLGLMLFRRRSGKFLVALTVVGSLVGGSALLVDSVAAQTSTASPTSSTPTSTAATSSSSSSAPSTTPSTTTASSSNASSTTAAPGSGPSASTSPGTSSTSAGPSVPTSAPSTTGATNLTTTVPGGSGGSPTTLPGAVTSTSSAASTSAVFVKGRTLKQGMHGDDVLAMERKLDLLKYFSGKLDGKFDNETWQGVMAFQKFNGLKRTAQFDEKTQAALFSATVPGGVIPNGGLPRIEVDISRQVALIFDEYGLSRVVAVSSGSNKQYCDNAKPRDGEKNFKPHQVCGDARTPRGNFKVQRRIRGKRDSALGTLVNPLYFNGGYAIHGSPSVPGFAASHGCVRITNITSEWVFENVADATPVYVFD